MSAPVTPCEPRTGLSQHAKPTLLLRTCQWGVTGEGQLGERVGMSIDLQGRPGLSKLGSKGKNEMKAFNVLVEGEGVQLAKEAKPRL